MKSNRIHNIHSGVYLPMYSMTCIKDDFSFAFRRLEFLRFHSIAKYLYFKSVYSKVFIYLHLVIEYTKYPRFCSVYMHTFSLGIWVCPPSPLGHSNPLRKIFAYPPRKPWIFVIHICLYFIYFRLQLFQTMCHPIKTILFNWLKLVAQYLLFLPLAGHLTQF